jgi:hypothetical protein
MIGRPDRVGRSVEAADHGLQRPDARTAGSQDGDDRGRHDRLADAGVGPGDEAAPQARGSGGARLEVERAGLRPLARAGLGPPVLDDVHRLPGGERGSLERARVEPDGPGGVAQQLTGSAQLLGPCEAITARRSREVPCGPVGGRIASANTPREIAVCAAAQHP